MFPDEGQLINASYQTLVQQSRQCFVLIYTGGAVGERDVVTLSHQIQIPNITFGRVAGNYKNSKRSYDRLAVRYFRFTNTAASVSNIPTQNNYATLKVLKDFFTVISHESIIRARFNTRSTVSSIKETLLVSRNDKAETAMI